MPELMTKISLWLVLIINLLLLLMFVGGKVYVFELKKWIKFVALYSVVISGLLFLNICFIALATVLSLVNHQFLQALILPIFALAPFIIGKFTTYDKIKIYTNIQILQLSIAVLVILAFLHF